MSPYIISYLATGFLLAIGVLLGEVIPRKTRLLGALVIIVAWPLISLAAPEVLFRNRRLENELSQEESLAKKLGALAATTDESHLSLAEWQALKRIIERRLEYSYLPIGASIDEALRGYWDENLPPAIFSVVVVARKQLLQADFSDEEDGGKNGIRYSKKPPEWYIGFSNDFLKAIKHFDSKEQGRILKAIGQISEAPLMPHGNTILPLTGDLAGIWRYRIGESRILYYVHRESRRITLISFESRGRAYEEITSEKIKSITSVR